MPTAKRATKSMQCGVCSKSFKTTQALAQHSLDAQHRAEQCCRKCLRLFGSTKALDDHNKSTVHSTPQSKNATVQVQGTYYPSSIEWRGNSYTLLSNAEQFVVYEMLIASCHTPQCLEREKYVLAIEQQGRSGPARLSQNIRESLPTPKADFSLPRRKAVVLDCEMVGIEGGKSEPVQLSIIDFITGEILVHTLVKPRQHIVDWRSGFHGITPTVMSVAVVQGQVLDGWEAARVELWRHINEDTIVIGQSVNKDLQVLRVIHRRIVDSAILTAEAVYGQGKRLGPMWGLQELCETLLGLQIRTGGPLSIAIHDSFEDVLATRELVLFCLRNPAQVELWASKRRHVARGHPGNKRPARKPAKKRSSRHTRYGSQAWGRYDDDDDDEVERWEDIIDYDTWPKSPPDSD